MITSFVNEKHCREETIGVACEIAQLALGERRVLTPAEHDRIDALLRVAETTLRLSPVPRDAAALVRYAKQVAGERKWLPDPTAKPLNTVRQIP